MKLFGLMILLLVVGYTYPSMNEDVSSNCQAVEAKLLTLSDVPIPKLLTGLSQGEVGKLLAKNQFSDLPPQIGCAVVYWDVWLKSDKYRKAVKEFING